VGISIPEVELHDKRFSIIVYNNVLIIEIVIPWITSNKRWKRG